MLWAVSGSVIESDMQTTPLPPKLAKTQNDPQWSKMCLQFFLTRYFEKKNFDIILTKYFCKKFFSLRMLWNLLKKMFIKIGPETNF